MNEVVLRFPNKEEALRQTAAWSINAINWTSDHSSEIAVAVTAILVWLCLLWIFNRLIWAWRRSRQRRGKSMLSKKGMRASIRVKAARAITDIIEEDRFRGRISDEAARECYAEFGLNLSMSALLPRRPTQEELKNAIRNRLGNAAIPFFPDEVEIQSPEALIRRYLGGWRNIKLYVIRRSSIQK